MKTILFGATGMVGQGVLKACLTHAAIESVLVVGRTPTGVVHPRVRELVRKDLYEYGDVAADLAGLDACFFCLGVSSSGLDEAQYTHVTYDLALAAAGALFKASPGMTFCFVSGGGTDSSEKGRVMWARTKGRTENAIAKMGFRSAYMFRPAMIQPLDGIRSKTPSYRVLYSVMKPLFPVVRAVVPGQVTTTRKVGAAMIYVAQHGYPKTILENRDINEAAAVAVAAAT